MVGTIINVAAIIAGTLLGLLLGGRLTEKIRETVLAGLGIVTLFIGLEMAFETANVLIVLASFLLGGIAGELMRLEERLEGLGAGLEKRFNRGEGADTGRFIAGFITASLLFIIGPMAILGAIQDGLTGDFQLLAVKSMLDGFASLAFAASLGIGVGFSALPVLVYQGAISLLAAGAQSFLTDPMIAEMTATGGLLIVALAFSSLLQVKKIRVGSLLPAVFIAPLIVWVLSLFAVVP
jgi:uncharacterized membrane protein YqgA involved in biofilm formation